MAEAKLTKKQRKTKAFRTSDSGAKGDAAIADESLDVEVASPPALDKGKEKEKETRTEEASLVTNKKRKREEGSAVTAGKKNAEGRRYIVFVGNMAFKTTSEQIAKHFQDHCGEAPSVRLLTSKGDAGKTSTLSKSKQKSIAKGKAQDPNAAKSKGCAFVEFTNREALQKALQFHHTALHGRTINVELTAGGGGKGAERKERIEKKNRDLEEERKKIHEKYVKTANAAAKKAKVDSSGGKNDVDGKAEPKRPQWGPNADKSGTQNRSKTTTTTKTRPPPRWAASGANAVRLNG